MNDLLAPGDYVRHPSAPEWGLGQVQSCIGGRVTVNFEHAGKRVFAPGAPALTLVTDPGAQAGGG